MHEFRPIKWEGDGVYMLTPSPVEVTDMNGVTHFAYWKRARSITELEYFARDRPNSFRYIRENRVKGKA